MNRSMDLNEKIPKRNLRSPYYWTKKASEYKSDCKLLYSKDCLGKKEYQILVDQTNISNHEY